MYTKSNFVSLPSFGFDVNGTYSYDFTVSSVNTSLVLVDSDNVGKVHRSLVLHTFECSISQYYTYIDISNETISGVVSKRTVIYPYVVRCPSSQVGPIDQTVSIRYRNPKTYLDIRQVNSITVQMVFFIIFIISILIWVYNWIRYFKIKIILHYQLTLTFVIAFISHVLRYQELRTLSQSDEADSLTISRIISQYFLISSFLLFLLFSTKGFCIVSNTLSLRTVLWYLLITFSFTTFSTWFIYSNEPRLFLPLFLMFVISLVALCRELYKNIRNTSQQVDALLLTLSNTSIVQENLSIFLKQKLFHYIQIVLLFGMIGVSIVITMYVMNGDDWLYELGKCVVEYAVLLALGILFRLQGEVNYAAKYTKINDEEEQGDSIQLNDIEAEAQDLNPPTTPLLLQSPDGTESITPIVQHYNS